MLILNLIPSLEVGGAEKALFHLSRLLKDRGINSILVTMTGQIAREVFEPSEAFSVVESLNMQSPLQIFKAKHKLKWLISKYKPDLLQSWMYHANVLALWSKHIDLPNCWNIRHGLDNFRIERLKVKASIMMGAFYSQRASAIIYNSYTSQEQHQRFGFSNSQDLVIPNAVDSEKFSFSLESRKALRFKLRIQDDQIVITSLARFHKVKAFDILLKAVGELRKRTKNFVLLLGGRQVDARNHELESWINQQGIRDRTLLLGEVPNVPELLSATDIYVSSSLVEGFPNSLAEAMSVGCRCVATKVGDSKLIVGKHGRLVESGHHQELFQAIEAEYRAALENGSNRNEAGRESVVSRFSSEALVNNYLSAYENLGLCVN